MQLTPHVNCPKRRASSPLGESAGIQIPRHTSHLLTALSVREKLAFKANAPPLILDRPHGALRRCTPIRMELVVGRVHVAMSPHPNSDKTPEPCKAACSAFQDNGTAVITLPVRAFGMLDEKTRSKGRLPARRRERTDATSVYYLFTVTTELFLFYYH